MSGPGGGGRRGDLPRLPFRVLRARLRGPDAEFLLGDLEEEFRRRRRAQGVRPARRWLWRQVFRASVAPSRGRLSGPPGNRLSTTLESLFRDLVLALRLHAGQPGLTSLIVVTLALGIGANATVFGIADATLLRPPARVEQPRAVVGVYHTYGDNLLSVPYPAFALYRERNRVFREMAAYRSVVVHLGSGDGRHRLDGALVSGSYFPVLGVQTAHGRMLGLEDDLTPGAHPVAVVSHRLWRGALGGDPGVVGRRVVLNDHPFTVVGVAPPGFRGLAVAEGTDVWVPTMMQAQVMPGSRNLLEETRSASFRIVARLDGDVAPRLAEERLTELVAASEVPLAEGAAVVTEPWISPFFRDEIHRVDLFLAGVVALVLLLACANVANLLLVRGTLRRREMAIRAAIGGGRGRLLVQQLVEGMVLALGGGGLALLVAWAANRWLSRYSLTSTLSLADVDLSLDARVLGFTALVAMLAGLLFSVLPAVRGARRELVSSLRTGVTGDRRGGVVRGTLVVAQVAISVVLLVVAGLLLRSLGALRSVDLGFDAERIATAAVDLELDGREPAGSLDLAAAVLARLRGLEAVESASAADIVPFTRAEMFRGSGSTFFYLDGRDPPEGVGNSGPGGLLLGGLFRVGPSYFETMGIPLLAGRSFERRDDAGAPGVVIVDRRTAGELWPGEAAVGRQVRLRAKDGPVLRVVGVVDDVRLGGSMLTGEGGPWVLYRPLAQDPPPALTFLARAAGDAGAVAGLVREQIRAVDPELTTFRVGTLAGDVAGALWQQRLLSSLLTVFGSLALALAAVGLYGVLAHGVRQRVFELGVRRALGARQGHLLGLVVRRGATLVLLGTAIGLTTAAAAARWLEASLHGIEPLDPWSFAAGALAMVCSAGLACWVPARRATRVDPMTALRVE